LNLLEAITAAAILGLLNFVLLGYIYYVFKRDLTERRRAESALRTSEERLRLLIASSKDYAFFMLDPHGKVATWNDGAQIIKGYEAGEIMGRSFSTFFPDEEQRAGKPALILAKAIKEGRAEVEGWRVRKDGSQFWANAITSAVRDEQGRLLGFSEVTRDLTERRAAEEKIHQSQTRLAAILDGSPSVIFVKDPAGQYTLVNRKFEEAFRVKREQVLGMTDMHFFPMDVAQKLREHDVKALESAQAMEFEEVIPQTDGSHIYLSARVPLLGDDHQPYALCGVFTDITERKQSEEEIRRLNRTLQDRVVDRSVELMRAADELKMERAERASVEQSAREVWDRLREVFDRSPVPMLIYDLETLALLEANNSAAALYGSTRPELLKMRMTDLCPMEDVARLGEDVVRGGLSPDSPRTCRHRSKGGQVISVGIIARRIEWEGRRSALAVVITENERHRLQDIALALEAAGPEA
jgi:PAS domain S-box-containing protein